MFIQEKRCDLINSKIREHIFPNLKKKYEIGEIILFNNYYISSQGISYYTSQQMIVSSVKELTLDLSSIDIHSIFTMSFKKKNQKIVDCVICNSITERESIYRLCNSCIREWIDNKLVCPYILLKYMVIK